VEYGYHLRSQRAGKTMMPSQLVDNKHFATQRYDRLDGEKQPILTASGFDFPCLYYLYDALSFINKCECFLLRPIVPL
jgi:hypothetical protein